MERETTGQTISRLGVLTVLTGNLLGSTLDSERDRSTRKEINAILNGQRGPSTQKVQQRSYERCVMGRWN